MNYKSSFTMAEVLITLGIIGIIAAMTLPALINKYQEVQFKSAYKKAYADLSNAFQSGFINQEFTRTAQYEKAATEEEFNLMKNKFKVLTDCGNKDIHRCWKKGDTVCGGSCSTGNSSDGINLDSGQPADDGRSSCFIDGSGRNWCTYAFEENLYLVDTNGFSNPNQFGKDRWIFTFADINNTRANNAQKYRKISSYQNKDVFTQSSFCKHPPCYYQSWLLK